jgi:hypothetical protein
MPDKRGGAFSDRIREAEDRLLAIKQDSNESLPAFVARLSFWISMYQTRLLYIR